MQIFTDSSNNPLSGEYSVEELLEAFSEEVGEVKGGGCISSMHSLCVLISCRILMTCAWAICSHTETTKVSLPIATLY